MLRYVEQTGLVSPARSASGYRLYGPAQLQRLRTLKELLARFDVGLVRRRVRRAGWRDDPDLRDGGRRLAGAEASRPEDVGPEDWLRFEQEKHQRLLAVA